MKTKDLHRYTNALLAVATEHATHQTETEVTTVDEQLAGLVLAACDVWKADDRDALLVALANVHEHLVEHGYATEYDLPRFKG